MKSLDSFVAALEELSELVLIQTVARGIFPRYAHVLQDSKISKYWYDENEIARKLDKISSREGTSNRGVYLLAWGSFEEFCRGFVRDVAEIRNQKEITADEQLCNQHAIICSDVIIQHLRGSKTVKIDPAGVGMSLSGGLSLRGKFWPLNGEALSAFGGRFDDDQIEKIGKRIGLKTGWSAIAAANFFTENRESGTPADWTEARFCEIRDTRNRYAHEGVGADECLVEVLERDMKFLEALARRMVEIAESECN